MLKRAAFTLLIVSASVVCADSWMPPSKETYRSPDGSAQLTVTPRDLESALSYFEDKVEGRKPAGAPMGSQATSATATMERRSATGRWERAWTKPLDNEVAPVEVIVANGGQGFATFDNWHSVGHGPNAIAIYDSNGELIRRFGLTDLMPIWFVATLPHSVSSIHWRTEARISVDGQNLIVPVVRPSNDDQLFDEATPIDLAIRLSDGAPVGLEQSEWKTALAEAAAIARERCSIEIANLRKWNAPISAPKNGKEEDWHDYLRETQFRTKWSNEPPFAGTTVLRSVSAPDFKPSVKWLEEALTESAMDHDLRAIGSPDIGRLTTEIERIGAEIRSEQLKGVDLVIVADARHSSRIRAALAGSGAGLTIIDPARSIPQVKQRIRDESDLTVCRAPKEAHSQLAWWHALPLLIVGGGIFLLRRG